MEEGLGIYQIPYLAWSHIVLSHLWTGPTPYTVWTCPNPLDRLPGAMHYEEREYTLHVQENPMKNTVFRDSFTHPWGGVDGAVGVACSKSGA